MMSLRQMEVFYAIMRTGSVTAAASALNVTQPAASAVLKHCEDQLGIKLFSRVGGRLQPSREAEAIFPDIEGLFGRLEAVRLRVQDLAGGRLGALSVAGAFPIANGYLAAAVATFIRDRPRMSVALHSLTSLQVVDRVLSREVDLGVTHATVTSADVTTNVLVRSHIACVMRTDHPLADRDELALGDLEGYPIITYLPQVLFRSYVDTAFKRAGVVPDIRVQVGISLTGMMLAYHGAGVALIEPFLPAAMTLPGLVARPIQPSIDVTAHLIRHRAAPSSHALDEFVDHLRRTVGDPYRHKATL